MESSGCEEWQTEDTDDPTEASGQRHHVPIAFLKPEIKIDGRLNEAAEADDEDGDEETAHVARGSPRELVPKFGHEIVGTDVQSVESGAGQGETHAK